MHRWNESFRPVVSSTMDWAREIAGAASEPGVLYGTDAFRVRTAQQTRGRGRRGNRWFDLPGHALLTTLAVRRGGPWDPGDENPGVLSLRAGLAVAWTAEQFGVSSLRIKWPNDILLGDRKLAGVLIEADPRWFFVGIGLNIRKPVRDPGDREMQPADLHEAVPGPLPGVVVLSAALDESLQRALTTTDWREGIERRLAWRDAPVDLRVDNRVHARGTLVGLAENGSIVLKEGGEFRGFAAGTLRLATSSHS